MGYSFYLPCPKCLSKENIAVNFSIGELNNQEFFHFTCREGHEIKAFITVPRFSLLFENGLTAFNQGFLLESFSCFYSALENFRLEFSKAYLNLYSGMDIEIIDTHFSKHKLSERIYGAYAQSYLSVTGKIVDTKNKNSEENFPIDRSTTELRNIIVHAGHIPSPSEIEEMAYRIYCHMKYGFLIFAQENFDFFTYYGNRYSKWAENNVTIDTFNNNDTVLFGMDYGAFAANETSIDFNNLPCFKDLLTHNQNTSKLWSKQ